MPYPCLICPRGTRPDGSLGTYTDGSNGQGVDRRIDSELAHCRE